MTIRQLHDETPWWVKLVLPIILSAVISGIVSFSNTSRSNDRDLVQRVSALESHRTDDANRLDRIERTLDSIAHWAGLK